MKKRLLEFLAYLEIGQTKFEEKTGLSRGLINNIKGNISIKSLNKISLCYPELNMHWLQTGEGKMLRSEARINTTEPQPGEQMKFDFSALIRVSEKTAEAVQTIANSNEKMAESNKLLAETNAEMWQTIKGKLERIEELLEKKGGNVQGIPRVV